MTRTLALFTGMAVWATGSAVFALYSVSNEGTWPNCWPGELEPLRKQSRTLVGPMIANRHYQIPFTSREEFEEAWPYLLKVKSPGAPIILVRGPKTDFMKIEPAGVLIHSPPEGSNTPETPIIGITETHVRWMHTTYIELVVDGKIVDLNRIALPADTPIIDQRFADDHEKP